MTVAIAKGAQGFVVERLQQRLNIAADGDFGPGTRKAVEDHQAALGHKVTGRADQAFFEAVGARWPSSFERCLQISDAFEGTGFGGVNRTDIDGAGVTLGIVGFTTESGEVQRLVRQYVDASPTVVSKLPAGAKERLLALCKSSGRNREAWDRWFYGGDGEVDAWIRDIVRGWGRDQLFQRLQLEVVEKELWLPTLQVAEKIGLKSMAAVGLLFDVRVQNGGFSARHMAQYKARMGDSEVKKMESVVNAVCACCKRKWRDDVRARKSIFVGGMGTVHKRFFDLSAYGFE